MKPARGFTLVEMSVVLVIIAVIIGAVTVGNDLMRQAQGQRAFSDFVSGWSNAFTRYYAVVHAVPGDNPVTPTHVIRGAGGSPELCNTATEPALTNVFLARGITLPPGWTPGEEDRYMYQDGNGSPHQMRVCFRTVAWAVPGTSSGSYVLANRHVMQLTGLTNELAMQFDSLIDGRQDARFGRLRSVAQSASLSDAGVDWGAVRPSGDAEAHIAEVAAYLEMN